jgi:hypothetical protein
MDWLAISIAEGRSDAGWHVHGQIQPTQPTFVNQT